MEYKISAKALHVAINHPTLLGKIVAANNKKDTDTVRLWFKSNKPNGPLTMKVNIDLIKEHTNLTEPEILEVVNKNGEPIPHSLESLAQSEVSDK